LLDIPTSTLICYLLAVIPNTSQHGFARQSEYDHDGAAKVHKQTAEAQHGSESLSDKVVSAYRLNAADLDLFLQNLNSLFVQWGSLSSHHNVWPRFLAAMAVVYVGCPHLLTFQVHIRKNAHWIYGHNDP